MKVYCLTAIAAFAVLHCAAQEAKPSPADLLRKQMEQLLDDLPGQSDLTRYQALVTHPETAKDSGELDRARKKVQLAQERIPKIRALIKVGTSVFDYPGLLAAGRLHYDALRELPDRTFEFDYIIYFGVFVESRGEGVGASDFEAVINEKGIITEVRNVRWLH